MEGAGSQRVSPLFRTGLIAAVAALVLDQASKLWLLNVFELGPRGATPGTRTISGTRNKFSYGQTVLLAFKALAIIVLGVWMARSGTRLAVIGLGLIIGGAIGNTIDRLAYGAVVDFAHFHLEFAGIRYSWYVFNLADVAIVAGVAALLYDSFLGVPAAKAP